MYKKIPAYEEWRKIHLEHRAGWTTSAFYGLQWASSRWYISDKCGCGSRYRQLTPTSEPIVDEVEYATRMS